MPSALTSFLIGMESLENIFKTFYLDAKVKTKIELKNKRKPSYYVVEFV